jgi:hypothetical protein
MADKYRSPEGLKKLKKAMGVVSKNWYVYEADKHPRFGWNLRPKKGKRYEFYDLYLHWDGRVISDPDNREVVKDITAPGAAQKVLNFKPVPQNSGKKASFNQAVAALAKKDIGFRRMLLAALGKPVKRPRSSLRVRMASGVKVANVVKQTMDAYADNNYTPSKGYSDYDYNDPAMNEAMQKRDLRFRARQWIEPRAWAALMDKATPGGYNYFSAKKTLRWLNSLEKKLGMAGTLKMQPAREGSVAVYITGPREVLEAIIKGGRRHAAAVDEAWWERGKEGEVVRLWWD